MSIGQSIVQCAVISSFALFMLLALEKKIPQTTLQMSLIKLAFAPHFTDAQVKRDARGCSLPGCRIAKTAQEERVPRSLPLLPFKAHSENHNPLSLLARQSLPLSVKCCNSR